MLLLSTAFREQWSRLHANCSWATVFQSPAFATVWYRVYAQRYEPVVVYRSQLSGTLSGLLLLAREHASGQLVNVGTHHAEYHTWLASADWARTFPIEAIAALRALTLRGKLSFLFLAPGTPLVWTSEAERLGLRLSVQWNRRGLMQLGPSGDVLTSLRKSGNKSRLARLRRLGSVALRQLHTQEELEAVFPVVADQSDVRQGGRSGTLPFRADPLKKPFYLACMAEPGLVHATVLEAGDEVLGAHVTFDDRIPTLGLITYAPQHGAHSPGKLLMLLLGKLLGEQGYSEFDMTPGRPYKERFATRFEPVAALDVFLDDGSYLRHRSQRFAADIGRQIESATGWNLTAHIQRARRATERLWRTDLRRGISVIARRVRVATLSVREFRNYEYSLGPDADMGGARRLRVNCLRDLLCYQPASAGSPSLVEFLGTTIRRMEDGLLVFTYAEDELLLHYSWLTQSVTQVGSEFGHAIPLREPSSVLWDDFTHPVARGRGLHQESLRMRLSYAADHGMARVAVIGVRADNGPSRHNIEKAGFQYAGSAWISTRLGRSRRWVTWVTPGQAG